ncbi:unnamed protein product [Candida verbasci]|uniref:Uncharacterized protein n=1 Tax=Candida verbasci TaxID=1227364 RepID=A0A9W4TS27_9ASCO|nr:unnamed protein product [Candida verbasci]
MGKYKSKSQYNSHSSKSLSIHSNKQLPLLFHQSYSLPPTQKTIIKSESDSIKSSYEVSYISDSEEELEPITLESIRKNSFDIPLASFITNDDIQHQNFALISNSNLIIQDFKFTSFNKLSSDNIKPEDFGVGNNNIAGNFYTSQPVISDGDTSVDSIQEDDDVILLSDDTGYNSDMERCIADNDDTVEIDKRDILGLGQNIDFKNDEILKCSTQCDADEFVDNGVVSKESIARIGSKTPVLSSEDPQDSLRLGSKTPILSSDDKQDDLLPKTDGVNFSSDDRPKSSSTSATIVSSNHGNENKENETTSKKAKVGPRKRIQSKPLSQLCTNGPRVGLSKRVRIDSLHNIKKKPKLN